MFTLSDFAFGLIHQLNALGYCRLFYQLKVTRSLMEKAQRLTLPSPCNEDLHLQAQFVTCEYRWLQNLELDVIYQMEKVDFIKKSHENTFTCD